MDAQALIAPSNTMPQARLSSLLLGCAIKSCPDRAERASPVSYVSANSASFLIVHGDRDPLVPYQQSVLLDSALRQAGVPVTFYTVVGAGHGGFTDPRVPELTQAFFAKHLKPQEAL